MTPINAQTTSNSGFAGTAAATRLSAETVVCGSCGCRLTVRHDKGSEGAWYHFEGQAGHDARGCAVRCANAPHTI